MVTLLNLPKTSLNNVLKSMDYRSLVLLSLINKRMIPLVKSMNIKLRYLVICLRCRVYLSLEFANFDKIWIDLDYGYSTVLDMLNSKLISVGLRIDSQSQRKVTFYWKNPKVREWIDHLRYIFSYQYIDIKFFNLSYMRYSRKSVVRTVKGIPIRTLDVVDIYSIFKKVLPHFSHPKVLRLNEFDRDYWGDYPTPCSKYMAKLFIQNFDAAFLGSCIPITLDNLLMTNIPYIWVQAPKLSDRELNMYIKFWMKNSTPKLEYLRLGYSPIVNNPMGNAPLRRFNKDVIFKGIDYIERSSNLTRTFQYAADFQPYHCTPWEMFSGGFDITRRDGTTCTVFINFEIPLFKMFVWP